MAGRRIHITGPAGGGTTTLGSAIGERLGLAHFDTDAFYWQPTDPPFTAKRAVEERLSLLDEAFARQTDWVLSGSLTGWGDALTPRFDLVVFLYVPQQVRIARLLERERNRYGDAILPGGPMHDVHTAFIEWALRYEDPAFTGRSLAVHEAWLAQLQCLVMEIRGEPALEESLRQVLEALGDLESRKTRT